MREELQMCRMISFLLAILALFCGQQTGKFISSYNGYINVLKVTFKSSYKLPLP